MKSIRKSYKDGFFVDLIDYYPRLAKWYAHSEIETQDWLIDNVKSDWVCLDCGAHIGYYSMLLSYLASDGYVWAFEPSRETRDKFWRNVCYNEIHHERNFSSIELINTALGDKVGKGVNETLYLTGQGNDKWDKTPGRYQFTTIDYFCEMWDIPKVDFIKSDVDGWDYELLLGARHVMETLRPIVIAEVNFALGWRGHTQADVVEFLREVNYSYRKLDCPEPENWLMTPNEKELE